MSYQPPFYVCTDGNGHYLGIVACECHESGDPDCSYCSLENPYHTGAMKEQANPEGMSSHERLRAPKETA